MTAQIKYSEALQKAKDAREEAGKLAKDALSEGAKAIFEEYPKLTGFRWTQYTPYFNDGEACEFSVNTDPCIRTEADEEFLDEYDNEDESLKPAFEAVSKLLGSVGEEDMQFVFGDHCEVTATRDGFEVEEYSHD